MRRLLPLLTVFLVVTSFAMESSAQTTQTTHRHKHKQYTPPPEETPASDWASTHSQWDFSGLVGLFNPGFGVEGLAAYRVVNQLVTGVDNSLSVEAGLGWASASSTVNGFGYSYSFIEIPIMARWDFHLANTKITVGPRAGFDILAGGTATVNGNTVTGQASGFDFQIGGYGNYQFSDHWAGRLQLMLINYTAITVGATYFL